MTYIFWNNYISFDRGFEKQEMKNWLIIFLFLVRVKVPFGIDLLYHHVKSAELNSQGTVWALILEDGRKAFIPAMWTSVEEEPSEDK